MKDLKPKIEKVLVKSIKEWFDSDVGGEIKVFVEDNKVRVKSDAPYGLSLDDDWFFVPDYDHEEAWCFTCDGGMGWSLMNPDESDYPSYEFEESVSKNFKEAGLFVEPYASWKFIVTES